MKKYTFFLLLFFVSYQHAAFQDPLEKNVVLFVEALQSINKDFIEQESKMTKAELVDKYMTLFKANEKALNATNEQIVDLEKKFEENIEKEREDQAEEFSKNFFTVDPKQTSEDLARLLTAVSVEFSRADDKNKVMFLNKSFKELLSSFPFKGRIIRIGPAPKDVIQQFVKDKPDIAEYKPAILYTIYLEKKYQKYISRADIYRQKPKEVGAFLDQLQAYLKQEIDTKFLAQDDVKKLMQEQKQLNDKRSLLTEKLKVLGQDVGPVPTRGTGGAISQTETLEAILRRVEEEQAARKAHEGSQESGDDGSGATEEEWEEEEEWGIGD